MKQAEKSKFSFHGLFSKKPKPGPSNPQSSENKAKLQADQLISIKHSDLPLIQIKISPQKSPTFNCGDLLELAKKFVAEKALIQSLKVKPEEISQLKTQDHCLSIDYWLTLKDKPVSELPSGISLTTYTRLPRSNPVCIEDFECLAKVGTGAFASVYLARQRWNGEFVAIKQISKGLLDESKRSMLIRERNAMMQMNQNFHIVKLLYAFQTDKFCFLVMEFMPGSDLSRYMQANSNFTENTAKILVAEALIAVESLHLNNIIYRDLKPENLLMDIEGRVHLSDFGLAKKVSKLDTLNYTICGTEMVMAPEIAKQKGHNHLADFYNIGTLAFELVSGMPPFDYYRKFSTEMRVNVPYPLIPKSFSSEFKDLCNKLLVSDPIKRLGYMGGITEIREHSWFEGVNFKTLETRKGEQYLGIGLGGVNLAILDNKIAKNPFDVSVIAAKKQNFNETYFEIPDFYYNHQESNILLLENAPKAKNQWDEYSDDCSYSECMEEKNSYGTYVHATERYFNSFCSTEDMNRTIQQS